MLSNCQNLNWLTGNPVAKKDGGKRFTAAFNADVILRMCSELAVRVFFSTGLYTILANNSICLIVDDRSCIADGQIGVADFKYEEKFAPTHRSRDTAHSQWLQKHCQWYPMGDVRTHNSRTDSRRIFKLCGGVDHVTRHA